MAKILVTGAAGFIGYHTSERLLARGDEVVGLDNINDYYDPTLKESRLARLLPQAAFRFVKMELGNREAVDQLFREERFDRVIHLAAQAGVRYSLQCRSPCTRTSIIRSRFTRQRRKPTN